MIIVDKTVGGGAFPPGTSVIDFFGQVNGLPGGERVQMGISVLSPGQVTQFSAHAGDEYSFVVSGNLRCFTHSDSFEIPPGGAIFTPAGEEHRSENPGDSECVCVWIEIDTK